MAALCQCQGGVLIEDVGGFTIGAIGISGDTSEKDEYCAISAVQDAGLLDCFYRVG